MSKAVTQLAKIIKSKLVRTVNGAVPVDGNVDLSYMARKDQSNDFSQIPSVGGIPLLTRSDVQISTRNLLPNTWTDLKNESFTPTIDTQTFNGHPVIVNDKVPAGTGFFDAYNFKMNTPARRSYYALSFWAKAAVDKSPIKCYFYSPDNVIKGLTSQNYQTSSGDGSVQFSLSTAWEYYWVIWNQSVTDAQKTLILGRHDSATASKTYYSEPMFVEGNQPIAAMPAPEDFLIS